MEELSLEFSLDELEEIQKLASFSHFDFPAIYFSSIVFFNKASKPFVKEIEAIKWFVTSEYVIFLPAKRGERNSFLITTCGRNSGEKYYIARFPSVLRDEKKLKCGVYKLMKYKNGFAFKRYEPIEVNK